jgi:hypothetical protein
MKGKVLVGKRDGQQENHDAIKPLLNMAGKRKGLIASPRPCYWSHGCCEDIAATPPTSRDPPTSSKCGNLFRKFVAT